MLQKKSLMEESEWKQMSRVVDEIFELIMAAGHRESLCGQRIQDSEERLQQPSLQVKVAITREQSFSLQFHKSKPRERGYNYCYPPTINKSRIEACRSTT